MNTKFKSRIVSVLLVFALCFSFGMSEMGTMKVYAIGSTQDTATTLNMNGQWSEITSMSSTDNIHWYKMVIPTDGIFSIRLMSYFNSLAYTVYNYDLSVQFDSSSYWPIHGSAESPNTKTLGSWVFSAGTYYIQLRGDGNYRIAGFAEEYFSDLNIGATTYDSPVNMRMGATYIGDFTQTDTNSDWYKITIPNNQYYVVSLKSYFRSLAYNVYNYDLSKCLKSSSYWPVGGSTSSPGTENVEVEMSPGTYFIKLDGGKGKYTVSISPLNQGNCSHDYKTERTDATYYADGYTTHTCKKCGYSYKDNTVNKKTLSEPSIYKYQTKSKHKKVTLSWSTVNNASGYEIEYSTSKNFKKSNTVTVKGQNKYRTTIKKKLKKNKKFYFRVRSFVKDGNNVAYSKWSKKISVKVK